MTDSWHLSRGGRLRTDLGGVYFNVLVALIAAAVCLLTGYQPLLIVVVTQQILVLDQFLPWVRLDGYHVVSDLIGVPDLFARIGPVLSSVFPSPPRSAYLGPQALARAAVTAWVFTTLVVLVAVLALIVHAGPGYLDTGWRSLGEQSAAVVAAIRSGAVVDLMSGALGTVMLILPVLGVALTYLLTCRQLGVAFAIRRARRSARAGTT